MNIVLLLAHSIEEHDQLRLLTDIGHQAFSIGGYVRPDSPHDPKRPPLPDVPFFPELKQAVDDLGTDDNLDAAKRHIPDAILDWADTIICHHYEHTWLVPQWERLRNHRVIWRTVGQSAEGNEAMMAPLYRDGLQIVRYSPKERNIPNYAGEDALIRFYKDPAEWAGWLGEQPVVINVTQHLRQRDPYTNWGFWQQATRGLARPHDGDDRPPPPYAIPLGPGSEVIGGPGELTYHGMQLWLQRARCYLYTGTQPASYTLGLIEAMMTGIPVVSIGPAHMQVFPYGPDLFEGHEITGLWADDPKVAHDILDNLLLYPDFAKEHSERQRARAIELFGYATIKEQWRDFLG